MQRLIEEPKGGCLEISSFVTNLLLDISYDAT